MAAVGSRLPSPEGFHCQPWASLIEAAKPLSQDGFVLDEGSKEMSKSRDLSHVMRLRKEDMHIFGHCPSQDEFYLVGCSVCQQFIKPQALQAHYERRHGQSSRQSSAQIKYFPAASAALPSPRQSSDRDNEQEWERDGFPHHAAILNSVPGSQITLNSSAPSSLQCRPRVDSPTRVGGTTTQVVAQPNRLLRPARERPLDAGGGGVGGGGKQRNLTASSKTADKSCVPVVSLHKVDGAPSVRMSPTPAPASSCFKQSICPSSTSSSISSSSSLPISTVTGPRHIPPHSPACPPRCPTTSTKSAKSCSPVMPSIKPQPLTRSRPATTPATCFVTSRPNPCPPSSLRSNTAAAAASGTPNPPGSAPATFRLGSTGPSLSSRNSQMSGTGHSPSPKQNTTGTNASANPPGSSCLTSSQEPTTRSVAPSLKVAGNSHSASRLGVGGRLASGKGSGIKTSVSVQHGPNGPTGPGPIPNGKALVPGRRSHGDDGRLARKISHKRPVEREFDPDRHCGVLDPDTKRPCTRSLTCKTHSLSQRRAVPGRRTKFDLLLAEHKVRARHSEWERDGEREREKEREKEKERGERLQQSPSLRDGERDGLCAVSTSNAPSTPLPSPESLSPIPVTGDAVLTSPAKHRATISRFHSMNLFPSRGGLVISPGNDVTHQPTAGDGLTRPSSDEGEADAGEDGSLRDECCFSVRHPHPQAVCVFGARQFSPGVFAFSRSWDHLRSAFSTIVEQHLASQTWRKFPSTSILPTASPGRAQSTGSLHPAFLPCSTAITCSSISTVTTSSDTMLRPSLQSLSTPIPRPTASLPAPSLLSKPSKLKAGKQGSRPSLRETALSSGSSGPASGGGRKKKASVVGEGSRKNCASTSRALSSHAGLLGNSEPARHQELSSSRLARPADPLTSGHLDSHCPGRCSPTLSPGRTAAFRRPEARKSRVVASSGTATASGGGEVKSSKVAKGLDMDCVHARPSGGRTARGNNLFTGHQSKNRTSASPSRSSPGTSPSPLNRPGR